MVHRLETFDFNFFINLYLQGAMKKWNTIFHVITSVLCVVSKWVEFNAPPDTI